MKVTKSDLIGLIKDYPIEIVERMLEEQVRQGNKENIKIFQEDLSATRIIGGFNWADTKEGVTFWEDIIDHNDFNQFFKLYPKKEETKEETQPKSMDITTVNLTKGPDSSTQAPEFEVFVDIAHDYILLETRYDHKVLSQIQIPILEFADILDKLKNHPNIQPEHLQKYLPVYNCIHIQDGSWTYSKKYF